MKFFLNRKLFYTAGAVLMLAAALCFTGCTSEISLELKKDGSVSVDFNGVAGDAFASLINAAVGGDPAASSENLVFNTDEIEYEMSQNGFSNVKAASKNGRSLSVSMTDKNGKSALFSSGVVSTKNGKLDIVLDRTKLVSFYNQADSQTAMFLDMLLAPVFNDEKMSEEEYLEVLASFYGQEIADEIGAADFRITIKNADGTQSVHTIKITKLLTLDEVMRF